MNTKTLYSRIVTGLVIALLLCGAVGAGAAESSADEPPLEISTGENGVSVFAVGVQADELFTRLARATGVGIIVDDSVGRRDGDKFTSRRVTVNLRNKKMSEIVASICTAYGLSYSRQGGVYMISEGIPKNPSSYLMSHIDSITTEYVLSAKAKSLLPEFLQAHVKVNEGKNAVVLSAPKEVLEKFREDIKQFDVSASQIMIDIIMVEFTDSAGKELGLDFIWSNDGRKANFLSGSGNLIYKALGTLTPEFSAKLDALVEQKKARVHANPRIATISGQTASIFVGRQRYLSQPVDIAGSGNVNYIDAGIKLEMTPWTGGDGQIIAEIHPEVSVMSAPDPITGLPEKSTRRANTEVRVKDGETIIIGGLVQTEMQSMKSKTPLLGDLPLIGGLFQRTNHTEMRTELVIFITPRILKEADDGLSEEQRGMLEQFRSENAGDSR